MNMNEAFEKAARQNPDSEIGLQVNQTTTNLQTEEKKQKEIKLRDLTMRAYGRGWKLYETYTRHTPLGQEYLDRLQEAWKNDDTTQFLIDSALDVREGLLMAFVKGTEILNPQEKINYLDSMMDNVSDHLVRAARSSLTNGPRFGQDSQIFFKALSDLLGYDNAMRGNLLDFMYKSPVLKGQVTITPAISRAARWFSPQQAQ